MVSIKETRIHKELGLIAMPVYIVMNTVIESENHSNRSLLASTYAL